MHAMMAGPSFLCMHLFLLRLPDLHYYALFACCMLLQQIKAVHMLHVFRSNRLVQRSDVPCVT